MTGWSLGGVKEVFPALSSILLQTEENEHHVVLKKSWNYSLRPETHQETVHWGNESGEKDCRFEWRLHQLHFSTVGGQRSNLRSQLVSHLFEAAESVQSPRPLLTHAGNSLGFVLVGFSSLKETTKIWWGDEQRRRPETVTCGWVKIDRLLVSGHLHSPTLL